MDVMFSEITSGRNFIIEIGYFDTVHEIKQKIEKLQGIPISNQTLVFKNQVMVNDRDTEFYEILHGSQIILQIKSEMPQTPQTTTTKPIVKMEESSSSTASSTLQLIIKFPSVKKQFSIDMEPSDSVMKVKEKIQGVERIPLNQFSLIFNNSELNENRSLEDYSVSNLSEIIVVFKSFSSASSNGNSSKRLKLMVLPKGGAQKIQVEVNAGDNVGELRKELLKLQQQINFCLPSEGYFFIYKQNVMDDDRSFRWHDVKQGDTIEIFNGSVTGGS